MADDGAWRIVGWNETFENAQSRKLRSLAWVSVPNRHDGAGFRRLMQLGGAEAYGAWILIVQVASKCPTRGVLHNGRRPLDEDDLADKTGLPAELFTDTLKLLSDPRILWVEGGSKVAESADVVAESAEASAKSPIKWEISPEGGKGKKGMEGKGREEDGKDSADASVGDKSTGSACVMEAAERKPREPNPIWDTVVAMWYPEGVPTSQRKAVGRIFADLKELGATPDEIRRRHAEHVAKWPEMTCTARSVVKNWGLFAPGAKHGGDKPNDNPSRVRAPAGKYANLPHLVAEAWKEPEGSGGANNLEGDSQAARVE